MNSQEIRWKVVHRMWRDNILESVRYADVDTVADFAVPTSEEGKAKSLISDEMVTNPDCPVVWGTAGEAICLRQDEEQVARYIAVHGGADELPWDLMDVLEEEVEEGKIAEEPTDTNR